MGELPDPHDGHFKIGVKGSTFLSHALVPFNLVDLFYQPIGVSVFIRPLQTFISKGRCGKGLAILYGVELLLSAYPRAFPHGVDGAQSLLKYT
jgi:hypothetical protein